MVKIAENILKTKNKISRKTSEDSTSSTASEFDEESLFFVNSITLNRQVCIIIDLAISRLDRDQRHESLDKFLTEYFLEQNLNAKISHQPGKKAQLFLKDISQEKSFSPWQAYDLHISYSLPLVAVTWSAKTGVNFVGLDIGVDLAQESEFVMEKDDWHALQQLYFSPDLPFFQTPESRCQAWSVLEAQHKCCGLALQEYSLERDNLFKNLSIESQFFDFKGQTYWLSVAKKQAI